MKIARPLTPVYLLFVFLTACSPLWGNSLPTPWPTGYLPTAVALTMAALPTPTQPLLPPPVADTPTFEPSATPEPSPSPSATASPEGLTGTPFPLPSLFPTDTPTPDFTPAPASAAAIQILTPGPLSKVRSPIKLLSYIVPGDDNLTRVELYGEDGRLLARQLLRVYTSGKWAYLSVEIPFEVTAAAEVARLQISTEDQFGRIQALTSVRLVLLSAGYEEINPPGNLDERCLLESPSAGARVSKGKLTVSGQMRPFNSQPLIVELITSKGAVVGSKMIALQPAADDSYLPIAAEMTYAIPAATWVRLTVRQSDERIPGTIYLFSQEVYLTP
ncbi:MAG: hypothetical protein QMD04_09470 [Anaerolineales bacterium]|nr:hypothetical protein [Anaerolineales bacterium]